MSRECKEINWRAKFKNALYRLLYSFVRIFIWLHLKLRYGLKVRRLNQLKEEKGPVLLLSNHQSFLDPFIAVAACRSRVLHFIASNFLFAKKFIAPVLRWMEVVPIKQFTVDATAVRQILQNLKKQRVLLLYPEGQRSMDGGSMPLQPGSLRLAERAKAAVYILHMKGAYGILPRWSRAKSRTGPLEVEIKRLCTYEELREKGPLHYEEELARIFSASHYQDWENRALPAYKSEDRLNGLASLLHRCVACGRVEALSEEGDSLICKYCGHKTKLSEELMLQEGDCVNLPKLATTAHLWSIEERHAWQISEECKEYREAAARKEPYWEAKARMFCLNDEGKEEEQVEVLLSVLDAELQVFSEGEIILSFPFGKSLCMLDNNIYFQLAKGRELYRFYPEEALKVIRVADIFLGLYDPS